MGNKDPKQVIDDLYRILNINIEWLKFAEAKNGALLVASAGWIFGILTYSNSLGCYELCYIIPVLLAFAALIISAVSFIPILNIKKSKNLEISNIIFFSSIAQSDEEGYLDTYKRVNEIKEDFGQHERHIANQIVNNAKIATYKYQLFKIAVYFFIASIATSLTLWITIKLLEVL